MFLKKDVKHIFNWIEKGMLLTTSRSANENGKHYAIYAAWS